MSEVSRAEVRELLNRDDPVAVVEVLPREEFQRSHLPGAVNVPMGEL